ncbi:hypothetical protein AVEN_179032-1 [Araneus ventricosus]|uniref:Uncharacterized protein n=1 Tax=Araneus ventricosus TaxID=182803 RepID=A0A4Y2VDG2_ARAVE|nr:hypothetical protein AVEN_179032-1 [Araneus ventricosus]
MDFTQFKTESCLYFQLNGNHDYAISVSSTSEEALLKALFGQAKIIYSNCIHKTLFVLARGNTFRSFYHRCLRKDAYRAMVTSTDLALDPNTRMTIQDAAQFRFFHRNNHDLTSFTAWYQLVQHIIRDKMTEAFKQPPTTKFGMTVHKLIQRSSQHISPDNHPSKEFYSCEILFTDSVPLGVAYRVENGMLGFVSPMVVSEQDRAYKDSDYVICNGWIPLYRNKKTWNEFRLEWYVTHLGFSLRFFSSILAWISLQIGEKYQQMYIDLIQAYFIIYGKHH